MIERTNRYRNKIRVFTAIGIFCLMAVLFAVCGKQTETVATEKRGLPTLRIGCDVYAPFVYLDTDGNPTGIDVELAREAASRLGYEPEFVFIEWEEKSKLLAERTIDCIWSSYSMDGRENGYQWAGPYMFSHQVIAVNQESDIYELKDLEGKTVAVQSTTKPEELFLGQTQPRIPKLADVFSLQKRELLYPFLSKGYVDAVAAHDTTIARFMSDYGVTYRILEEPLLTVGLGVAFAKDDASGLAERLSQVFDSMRADGTLAEIIGHYLEYPEHYLEVTDDEK